MAVVTKTDTAKATTAYKKTLATAVPYSFTWNEYEDTDTMVAAKDELTLEEQRKVRNVEAKTKARQAALTLALTAAGVIKPDAQNDSQVRLKKVYDGLMGKYLAAGMEKDAAHSKAREKAAEFLEETWDDEDDE